ncbi:hypothetical protein X975_19238, partial [Stegodyphus mimosarum]
MTTSRINQVTILYSQNIQAVCNLNPTTTAHLFMQRSHCLVESPLFIFHTQNFINVCYIFSLESVYKQKNFERYENYEIFLTNVKLTLNSEG